MSTLIIIKCDLITFIHHILKGCIVSLGIWKRPDGIAPKSDTVSHGFINNGQTFTNLDSTYLKMKKAEMNYENFVCLFSRIMFS